MTDFDPKRHKIVAVVTDVEDQDRGQHFHLSLPELVQEIHETNVIEADKIALALIHDRLDALDARPAAQLVPANVAHEIPEEFIERLQFIARGLDVLRARVEAMEADGSITANDAQDLVSGFGARLNTTVEDKIADSIGDIRSRLAVIEQRETPQVAKQVQKLGEVVHSLGGFIQSVEENLESKSGDLERKYAEIARHIGGVEGRLGKLAEFSHGLADLVKRASLEGAK